MLGFLQFYAYTAIFLIAQCYCTLKYQLTLQCGRGFSPLQKGIKFCTCMLVCVSSAQKKNYNSICTSKHKKTTTENNTRQKTQELKSFVFFILSSIVLKTKQQLLQSVWFFIVYVWMCMCVWMCVCVCAFLLTNKWTWVLISSWISFYKNKNNNNNNQ